LKAARCALFTLDGLRRALPAERALPAPRSINEGRRGKAQRGNRFTWDAARREIFGKKGGWDEEFGDNFKLKAFGREPQEYDARKVENLKQALLEALKSATNIRHLKSDESITVCVFAASVSGRPRLPRPGVSSGTVAFANAATTKSR